MRLKQLTGSFLILLLLLTGLTGIMNQMKNQYYEEGGNLALEDALRHSLMVLSEYEEQDRSMSETELYGELLKNLVLEMGDRCKLKITVYELNVDEGIMDIELGIDYQDFYGNQKSISIRKKAMLQECIV